MHSLRRYFPYTAPRAAPYSGHRVLSSLSPSSIASAKAGSNHHGQVKVPLLPYYDMRAIAIPYHTIP